MPFMNKSLYGAHMERSHLRYCYIKQCSEQNKISHAKQHNYYVSLFLTKQKRLLCKLE